MRTLLTICFVLLQLFSAVSAEAKPSVSKAGFIKAKKSGQQLLSLFFLHSDLLADHVQPQVGGSSVKVREQRSQLYALILQALQLLHAQSTDIATSFRDTPAPVPISRQLLFPQHYFW